MKGDEIEGGNEVIARCEGCDIALFIRSEYGTDPDGIAICHACAAGMQDEEPEGDSEDVTASD